MPTITRAPGGLLTADCCPLLGINTTGFIQPSELRHHLFRLNLRSSPRIKYSEHVRVSGSTFGRYWSEGHSNMASIIIRRYIGHMKCVIDTAVPFIISFHILLVLVFIIVYMVVCFVCFCLIL